MSEALNFALRNDLLDALTARLAGGTLSIYPAPQPRTPNDAPIVPPLVTITLPAPAFAPAQFGSAAKQGEWRGSVTVEGEAAWFRLKSLDGTRVHDGAIGTGEGQLSLDTTALGVSREVRIERFKLGASRPNVLLIVADDQRADALGEFMPVVEARIIGEGVNFTAARATTPLCGPSRASLYSGKLARNHGLFFNGSPLPNIPLAVALKGAGYRTALVGKYANSHDGSPKPEFDFWASFPNGVANYNNPTLNVNGVTGSVNGYITYLLRDYALQFLRSVSRDQPFLLCFTPNAPHKQFDGTIVPAPGHETLYPDLAPLRPPSHNEADVSDKPAFLQAFPLLTTEQIAATDALRRAGLQAMKAVDLSIGAILDLLVEQGKIQDTIIFYTSDNGMSWIEHRINEEKNYPYEEALRVPFAVRYPRMVAGGTAITKLVSQFDVVPTIYELAGVALPADVDGSSLVPLFEEGNAATWRSEQPIENFRSAPFTTYTGLHTGRYVSIDTLGDSPEFYDLDPAVDPYQLDNKSGLVAYKTIEAGLFERHFKPSSLGNLQVLLEPEGIASGVNGAGVGVWSDRSGSSRHLYQADPTKQFARRSAEINSKTVLQSDGANDLMELSSSIAVAGAYTYFCVFKASQTAAAHIVAGHNAWLRIENGFLWLYGSNGDSAFITETAQIAPATWYIVGVTRDATNKVRCYVNGVERSAATLPTFTATFDFLRLGGFPPADSFANIHHAAHILHAADLGALGRTKMFKYLNSKFLIY